MDNYTAALLAETVLLAEIIVARRARACAWVHAAGRGAAHARVARGDLHA